MSKEGRGKSGGHSQPSQGLRQRRERGAGALTVTSQGALSWTDATQLQQGPNRLTLSCFQDAAIKPCCKLPHVTGYLSSMCLRDSSRQVQLLGCTLILVGTALLPLKRAWPAHPPPAMLTTVFYGLAYRRLGKRQSVHQSDG